MTYGVRKLRSDYYSKKIKESSGDIRSTWKILKEITNNDNKSTSINEINIDGKVASDGKGISDALNDHFVSIGNKLAGEILDPVKASIDYLSKTGNSSPTWHGPLINMQKSVFLPLWDHYELYGGKFCTSKVFRSQNLKT